MTEIYGKGFGDSHDWKRGHISQYINGEIHTYADKGTYYSCIRCGVNFFHRYDVIPSIFEAIELSGVPDKCNKLQTISEEK